MKSTVLYNLQAINSVLREIEPSRVCIVTSDKLVKKFGWALQEIGKDKAEVVLIPDGEKAKSWKELENLLKRFSELGIDKQSVVIALGGGTVGDIVGFAASIYLRGIKYIQVPTTLLSQVDSAHGSKTGINFLNYKNQIGSFYSPIATVIDSRFIKTLNEELVIDGLGEIIKAGFIMDRSIITLLKKHTLKDLVNSSDLLKIIRKSIDVKNHFVTKNFNGGGVREILNVGHTLGHAIELKYKISHGKSVIVGMLQEFEVAERLGLMPVSVRRDLKELLLSLKINLNTKMKPEWETILHDKKIVGDEIIFPIVKKAGTSKIVKIDLKTFKDALVILSTERHEK